MQAVWSSIWHAHIDVHRNPDFWHLQRWILHRTGLENNKIRAASIASVLYTYCIFCRQMFLKTLWFPLWDRRCPSSSASHVALWRSSVMTAWCVSRCRRWCRTQSMHEMLTMILQIILLLCWKLHQWVHIAVSFVCLTSSKVADIASFESVIPKLGEDHCLVKTPHLYKTGCGRHAAPIFCQLLRWWISGGANQLYLLITWPPVHL